MIKAKPFKCKVCGNHMQRRSSLHVVCSPSCAIKLSHQKAANKVAKLDRAKKREFAADKKRLRESDRYLQIRLTQKAFNSWVRVRDHGKSCISCGIAYGSMHAGHYRSIGAAPELRFHPDNCHIQCSQCNEKKSGNIIEYRKNLVLLIGPDRLDFIESDRPPAKWTCEELMLIRSSVNSLIRSCNKNIEKYSSE